MSNEKKNITSTTMPSCKYNILLNSQETISNLLIQNLMMSSLLWMKILDYDAANGLFVTGFGHDATIKHFASISRERDLLSLSTLPALQVGHHVITLSTDVYT